MLEIQRLEQTWREDRPIIDPDNKNEGRIISLLIDEVKEAEEVLNNPVELGLEIADIILLTLALASTYGIDVDEVVRTKLARNHLKYPAKDFQDGDYIEKKRLARESWANADENFH